MAPVWLLGAEGTERPADLSVAATVFWMNPAHSAMEPKFCGTDCEVLAGGWLWGVSR